MTLNPTSKKRKASQQLEPGDKAWDRATFRVRNIPQQYDRLRLSQTLTEVLDLEDTTHVKVHSLVSQGFGEPRDKVATASFRRRPKSLSEPLTEWEFPLDEDDGSGKLFIDTRFNNFTILSSGESVSQESSPREYIDPKITCIWLLITSAALLFTASAVMHLAHSDRQLPVAYTCG